MAIHRRIRKAARNVLAHDRGHGQGVRPRLQGRGKDRRLAGSQEESGLDKRLSAVAAEVIAGRRVEVSWVAFRIVHFPGTDDLEAAGELGAWARRNGVGVDFEERKIRIGSREHEVLYVLFAAG